MTKAQLESLSDLEFAALILQDKLDHSYNPNTPMAGKLRMAINEVRRLDMRHKTKPKNYWRIEYTDETGSSRRSLDVPDAELDRISEMVKRGYAAGEMNWGESVDE